MSNIRCGAQLKAARALLGMTQKDLAAATGLHHNSIRYLEAQKNVTTGYSSRLVEEAFARRGVVFFVSPSPGVRMRLESEVS